MIYAIQGAEIMPAGSRRSANFFLAPPLVRVSRYLASVANRIFQWWGRCVYLQLPRICVVDCLLRAVAILRTPPRLILDSNPGQSLSWPLCSRRTDKSSMYFAASFIRESHYPASAVQQTMMTNLLLPAPRRQLIEFAPTSQDHIKGPIHDTG